MSDKFSYFLLVKSMQCIYDDKAWRMLKVPPLIPRTYIIYKVCGHLSVENYINFFSLFHLTHQNWQNINWTKYWVQYITVQSYGFLLFWSFGHISSKQVFYLFGPLVSVCGTNSICFQSSSELFIHYNFLASNYLTKIWK